MAASTVEHRQVGVFGQRILPPNLLQLVSDKSQVAISRRSLAWRTIRRGPELNSPDPRCGRCSDDKQAALASTALS